MAPPSATAPRWPESRPQPSSSSSLTTVNLAADCCRPQPTRRFPWAHPGRARRPPELRACFPRRPLVAPLAARRASKLLASPARPAAGCPAAACYWSNRPPHRFRPSTSRHPLHLRPHLMETTKTMAAPQLWLLLAPELLWWSRGCSTRWLLLSSFGSAPTTSSSLAARASFGCC